MNQRSKFWLGLIAITLVCYLDYHFFNEGYSVRKISSTVRQAGHLLILLSVVPIGYWAWKSHPLQWLKAIWMFAYGTALGFIITVGALKMFTDILPDMFFDWASTVRYFFCSPLPYLLVYMLTIVASRKGNQ